MGYKRCSILGCKTGCDGRLSNNVILHLYPFEDKELCSKWISANPRSNFVPTKFSAVCSLHFRESDYIHHSTFRNKYRIKKGKLPINKLRVKYLKADAVPSIFSTNLQNSSVTDIAESDKSTEDGQHSEKNNFLMMYENMQAEDDIRNDSLQEIFEKLQKEFLPSGYLLNLFGDILLIYTIQLSDGVPSISTSIKIDSEKHVEIFMDNEKVPRSKYKDLINAKVKKISEISNTMSRLNFWKQSVNSDIELSLDAEVHSSQDKENDENKNSKIESKSTKLKKKSKQSSTEPIRVYMDVKEEMLDCKI